MVSPVFVIAKLLGLDLEVLDPINCEVSGSSTSDLKELIVKATIKRCDWKMKVKRKWMISDWISEFHWHFGRIPGKIMRYKFYDSQNLNWLKGIIWSIPKSWRNNQHTETLGTIVGLRLDVKILFIIALYASMLDCWQWKNPKWMVKTFPTTCIYLKFTLYIYNVYFLSIYIYWNLVCK